MEVQGREVICGIEQFKIIVSPEEEIQDGAALYGDLGTISVFPVPTGGIPVVGCSGDWVKVNELDTIVGATLNPEANVNGIHIEIVGDFNQ